MTTPDHNENKEGHFPENRPENSSMLSQEVAAELKSAQTLTTVAMICGPVSLLIGGVILSTVAIICAVLAYWKTKKLQPKNGTQEELIRKVNRTAVITTVIGIAALVVNAIYVAMMMPILLETLNTGDISALQNGVSTLGESTQGGNSSGSSVWG